MPRSAVRFRATGRRHRSCPCTPWMSPGLLRRARTSATRNNGAADLKGRLLGADRAFPACHAGSSRPEAVPFSWLCQAIARPRQV